MFTKCLSSLPCKHLYAQSRVINVERERMAWNINTKKAITKSCSKKIFIFEQNKYLACFFSPSMGRIAQLVSYRLGIGEVPGSNSGRGLEFFNENKGNPARRCRLFYFFECDSKSKLFSFMVFKVCEVGLCYQIFPKSRPALGCQPAI